uniref:Tetraspanin 9b n=1 Tax=Poecilia latipinna TaxID=48699 RepID=A0A3B3THE7_9TELE
MVVFEIKMENARQDLKEGLVLYNTENNAGLRDAWNTIQREWECCGVTKADDWSKSSPNSPGRKTEKELVSLINLKVFCFQGCYDKAEQWVDANKHLLGTIAMCVLVIQLLGMAFSMTLYQQIHRAGKKYEA